MLPSTRQSSSLELREGVRKAYSDIAADPHGSTLFPTGRSLALGVGYPGSLVESLPAVAVDAFAGVSNVALFAAISECATVMDLGCGAGMDSLIASRRVGDCGTVIGVDFSDAMLERARAAVQQAGSRNISLRRGDAEDLPVESGTVDVALVNGIFNLNPARAGIFLELARVLRPGGSAFAAELALISPLTPEEVGSDASWFS